METGYLEQADLSAVSLFLTSVWEEIVKESFVQESTAQLPKLDLAV